MNLLDDSDEERVKDEIKINRRYADNFEARSRYQELQRNKELLLDDDESESTSESEDEDGEAASVGMDIQILKTINMIRKRDPVIYDSKQVWFEKPEDSDEGEDTVSVSKSKKKTYKDVVREQLLNNDEDELNSSKSKNAKTSSLEYDKEQQKLRQSIIGAMHKDIDEEDDILVVKNKNSDKSHHKEKVKLEGELSEMVKLGNKSEGDEFLADYFAKQKWKGTVFQDAEVREKPTLFGGNFEEDDEEEDDVVDKFESKYNFRFQELDGEGEGGGLVGVQVEGHARNVEGSLRRVNDKRKQQREAYNERKDKEKRIKSEELKRLKNLKRQELRRRLKKIADISGVAYDAELVNGNDGDLVLNEDALDEEWDPAKHEELMRKQFGESYYDAEDDVMDDEEARNLILAEDGIEESEEPLRPADYYDEEEVDPEEVIPALKTSKRRKSRDRKSKKFQEMADVNEDDDDDDDITGLTQADLERLYELDYEDIIGGDIKCRFKYASVPNQDYGLTVEDILLADDKELNQYRSIKKYSTYRDWGNEKSKDDESGKLSKKRKRLRQAIKERLEDSGKPKTVGSVVAPPVPAAVTEDNDHDDDGAVEETTPSEHKKRKRQRKSSSKGSNIAAPVKEAVVEAPLATIVSEEKVKRKRKHKKSDKPVVEDRMSLYK